MIPTRKPKVGLQRPKEKPPGKPKAKYTEAFHGDNIVITIGIGYDPSLLIYPRLN
jgi:hypothetical protein